MTKPKLLLADDSVTIRKVVELTFTDEGFDVTSVSTGEEALQKFAEIRPDIVIADVNMPEPTGYQLCEIIKNDESTKHIPVLLVVGSFEPFDQAEAERVEADGFLTKPFQSIRDLIIRVNGLLGPAHSTVPQIETSDIDDLFAQSFTDTSEVEVDVNEFADVLLGDAGMDDGIIEISHPLTGLRDHVEPPPNGGAVMNFISSSPSPQRRADDNVIVKPMRRKTDSAAVESSRIANEPTEEFVALVARRVVEKLADKIVREIANEAVPRIAERMIREALDEEKK